MAHLEAQGAVHCPACQAKQEGVAEDYAVAGVVGRYSELEHCCPVCLAYFNVRCETAGYVVEVSRFDETLNQVVCPGCGEDLPNDNVGCPHCGYEDNENGRILTLAEMLAKPSYPEAGALRLNDVCSAFLKRLVQEARKQTPREDC